MKPFDFFEFNSGEKPEKGDLLISQPFMKDGDFSRSVVFICEHNKDGTFGFVLNKRSAFLFDEVMEVKHTFDKELFVGGPVEKNTLHFLHKSPENISGLEVKNGIFWSGQYDSLMQLINTQTLDKEDVIFFLGYSGWSPNQLEEEIAQGSWIIYKETTLSDLFDTEPEDLWASILRKMGGKYEVFANYPEDPSLN